MLLVRLERTGQMEDVKTWMDNNRYEHVIISDSRQMERRGEGDGFKKLCTH